jgi:hypothetical protein
MVDSFVDASSLVLGKIETMYEAQRNIMGLLCVLNFCAPTCLRFLMTRPLHNT